MRNKEARNSEINQEGIIMTLAPLLKRLQKAGYINRVRPESNENKLFLSLTPEGERLKEQAAGIPLQM